MATTDEIEGYVRSYGPMILRRCRQLLRDEDEAYDAMQEVFVKLIEMGDAEIRHPSSLLYVIATRTCLNRLRSMKRRPEDPASDLVYDIAQTENLGQSAAKMMLGWLFGSNPESSQVIAVLHFSDGLTLEEVAEQVGMSVSGVRRRIRVMREQLRLEGGGE